MIQASQFFAASPAAAELGALEPPQKSTVVIGAPLSGKTTLLRSWVLGLEQQGLAAEEILVLTPTRIAAAKLRDQLALDSSRASSAPRAHSVTGYAYGLIAEDGWRLLSGAGQEQFIRELVLEQKAAWATWGLGSGVPNLRGFIQEMRDFFAVLIENRIDISGLEKLANQFPKLNVEAVLSIFPRYLARLEEQRLVDPTQLPLLAEKAAKRPRAILIDDAQNLSRGQLSLVSSLLSTEGSYLFGDPDCAVLGFRNSAPAAFVELSRARDFDKLVLAAGDSQPAAVRNLMSKIAQRIPANLETKQRPKPEREVFLGANYYPSQSQESDHLAAALRRLRLERDLQWDEMVVVGRTRTQLEQLAADMAARGVPTRIQGVQLALRDQPMARAILDFILIGLDKTEMVPLADFVTSPLLGLNSLEYRRLVRELRKLSGLSANNALGLVLAGSADFETPKPLAALVAALNEIRAVPEIGCYRAVSIAYRLANRQLATLAKGAGPSALAANRAIDSALELFAAAQRFDEKQLGNALQFAKAQLEIAIPEDSLAPIGLRPAVQLVTPSVLSGSFPVVAIPRLQEGIWPNLNPRNSLLGANSLQSFLAGRLDDPSKPDRSELADELRFFYRAIASAKSELILSAMVDQQEQPSQFFQMMQLEPELVTEATNFDLRQLVGRLRRKLASGDHESAATLAALAVAGVPGAHPRSWHGLLETGSVAISNVSSLAASRIEEFEKCPLHWFVRSFGGDASGFSASLGTLLHSALEQSGNGIEPERYVSENWHTLEFESRWQQNRAKRSASQMALLISEYLESANPAVASEQGFAIQVGQLEIRGKIDRVEKTPEGFEVVDLKTGKTAPGAEEVVKNRQLAIYQLAISQLHGNSVGGRIVSVGSGKLKQLQQPALSEQTEAELVELVSEISNQLTAGSFSAQLDEHCGSSESCTLLMTSAVSIG